MKMLIGLTYFVLISSAYAEEPPQHIEANFKITGELTADTRVLLTVGQPSKVEWKSNSEDEPDYVLLIPSPSINGAVPDVSGYLFVKHSGESWTAISESTSTGDSKCLLGLTQPEATMAIDAMLTTKEAFMASFSGHKGALE